VSYALYIRPVRDAAGAVVGWEAARITGERLEFAPYTPHSAEERAWLTELADRGRD
jgi:hypothetical protein